MLLRKLTVGNTQTHNNVFLAPMAGYTDYAFRALSGKLGYGLMFTELVSAKGIVYGGKDNSVLVKKEEGENTAVQIFGGDAFYMRSALESELLKDYKIADINMGCPVPKVYKNGEGSALLNDISRAEKIISECAKSGKVITVKIRTGLKRGDDVAAEFARMAESAGACLITIHGRVREDYYSGEPDYEAIARAKKAVSIPVIANGGIFCVEDADKMIENTGADGVMLARGGIADPFLVCKLLGKPSPFTLKDFMISQIDKMTEMYGDRRAAFEFRKFVPYYFKGKTGVKDVKLSFFSSDSAVKTKEIILSL